MMTNYVHVLCAPSNQVYSVSSQICGIDSDLFIAAVTFSIAVISILLSAYVAMTQKRLVKHQIIHDKLSVMPHLSFIINFLDEGEFPFIGIAVKNTGLGPALACTPLLLLDGNPIALMSPDNMQIMGDALGPPEPLNFNTSSPGTIILKGELYNLICLAAPKSDVGKAWLREISSRINIVICYSSIYKEKFIRTALYSRDDISKYPKKNLVFLNDDYEVPTSSTS